MTNKGGAGGNASILDAAVLARIRERAVRWHVARKAHSRARANRTEMALPSVAIAAELGEADAVVAQRYSMESEIARGSGLDRVQAAFPLRNARKGETAQNEPRRTTAAGALALAAGVAAGGGKRVVVVLLDDPVDESCGAMLRLAWRRKLPLIVLMPAGSRMYLGGKDAPTYEVERMPWVPVDRADPIAMHRVAHEAIERARIGYGPTLVECVQWPFAHDDSFGAALKKLESHIQTLSSEALESRPELERRISAEAARRASAEPEVLLFAPQAESSV
ncbi:MAG: hypothetical protein JO041_07250 [Acidobacteria bacterium]|nr:hypothetical protein [Acidobacteriota bacterium]